MLILHSALRYFGLSNPGRIQRLWINLQSTVLGAATIRWQPGGSMSDNPVASKVFDPFRIESKQTTEDLIIVLT
jgi:hypothetical protein